MRSEEISVQYSEPFWLENKVLERENNALALNVKRRNIWKWREESWRHEFIRIFILYLWPGKKKKTLQKKLLALLQMQAIRLVDGNVKW